MARNENSQQVTEIFGSGKHELKLGKSFQEGNSCGFHTVRYDFKPASVDHSKQASLAVGEKNDVTISFPNIENKAQESTVFGGSKKPYQKECVLIFDHRTREFTLERLSCNIQVKRQRQEGTSKAKLPPGPRNLHGPSKSSPNPRPSSNQVTKKKDLSTPINSPAAPVEKTERSPAPQPSPLATSELSPAPPGSVPSMTEKDAETSDSAGSGSDSDDDDSSSGSSASSSSEDEEEEEQTKRKKTEPMASKGSSGFPTSQHSPRPRMSNVSPQLRMSHLQRDLALSDSESDSD